jgi:cytochrome c peroxidase
MKAAGVAIVILVVMGFIAPGDFFEKPAGWPEPVYAFKNNALTKQKLLLGRVLFYDPLLSGNMKVSCADCHSPFSAFAHTDHALSHGIGDSIGTRNAPALMNLAWQRSFMWDGAVNNLDMQALAPISHPSEMGSSIQAVVEKLRARALYRRLFKEAFGDSLATGEHTLKALSQFMLSLVSANSKYDRVKKKEEQFTEQEAKGYNLFKANCATCHAEPLFTSNGFANNGLPPDPLLHDPGKMNVTKNSKDSLQFKIPTLRNIEYTYPYMHDGRFKKLSQVLDHYTQGIQHSATLAPQLQKKIVLSPNEKVDLVAFLLTLSDKAFVFNKDFGYPREVLLPIAK